MNAVRLDSPCGLAHDLIGSGDPALRQIIGLSRRVTLTAGLIAGTLDLRRGAALALKFTPSR